MAVNPLLDDSSAIRTVSTPPMVTKPVTDEVTGNSLSYDNINQLAPVNEPSVPKDVSIPAPISFTEPDLSFDSVGITPQEPDLSFDAVGIASQPIVAEPDLSFDAVGTTDIQPELSFDSVPVMAPTTPSMPVPESQMNQFNPETGRYVKSETPYQSPVPEMTAQKQAEAGAVIPEPTTEKMGLAESLVKERQAQTGRKGELLPAILQGLSPLPTSIFEKNREFALQKLANLDGNVDYNNLPEWMHKVGTMTAQISSPFFRDPLNDWDKNYGSKIKDKQERKLSRMQFVQELARIELADTIQNKLDAGQELSERDKTLWAKVGGGGINNLGYTLSFALDKTGKYALARSAFERYFNLTADEMGFNPQGDIGVKFEGDKPLSEGGLGTIGKSVAGAAVEVAIEKAGGELLGSLGGKLFKSIPGGKQLAGTVSKFPVIGSAMRNFAKFSKVTGIHSAWSELGEEFLQDIADAGVGFSLRESEKAGDQGMLERIKQTAKSWTNPQKVLDTALAMVLQQSVQGGLAGIQAYRNLGQEKNVDVLLQAFGATPEEVKTMTPEDKQVAFQTIQDNLTPDKSREILRRLGTVSGKLADRLEQAGNFGLPEGPVQPEVLNNRKADVITDIINRMRPNVNVRLFDSVEEMQDKAPEPYAKMMLAGENATGTEWDGDVYLVLDRIRSPSQAVDTVLTNSGVGASVNTFMTPDEKQKMLGNLGKDAVAQIQNSLEQEGRTVADMTADEIMAVISQYRESNSGAYNRAVAQVKRVMKRVNPSLRLNNEDVQAVFDGAVGRVEAGIAPVVDRVTQPAPEEVAPEQAVVPPVAKQAPAVADFNTFLAENELTQADYDSLDDIEKSQIDVAFEEWSQAKEQQQAMEATPEATGATAEQTVPEPTTTPSESTQPPPEQDTAELDKAIKTAVDRTIAGERDEGRRDLANPAGTEVGRTTWDNLQEQMKNEEFQAEEKARQNARKEADLNAEAQQHDWNETRRKLANNEALLPSELWQAKQKIEALSEELRLTGDTVLHSDLTRLMLDYTRARGDIGAELAMGRDRFESPLERMKAAFLSVSVDAEGRSKLGKKIKKLEAKMRKGKKEKMPKTELQKLEEERTKLIEQLKEQNRKHMEIAGYTPEKMKEIEALLTWTPEKAQSVADDYGLTVEQVEAMHTAILKNDNVVEVGNALGIDRKIRNDLVYSIQEDYKKGISEAHQVLDQMAALKSSFGDRAYEYWVSSLLSGPQTFMANLTSNTANSMWELGPQRIVEILINEGAGVFGLKQEEAAQFGELKYMGLAWARSFKPAWMNFVESWRTEKPAFMEEFGRTSGSLGMTFEGKRAQIAGKLGRFVRTPLRLLLATDEFNKTITWYMETAAYAYRYGKQANIPEGEAMIDYIDTQMANKFSKASKKGYETALRLAFQTPLGDKNAPDENRVSDTEKLSQAIGNTPAKYIVPFRRTPVNIFKTGMRKTPLGTLNMLKKLRDTNVDSGEKVRLMAEQVFAWGMIMAFADLIQGDDGDDEPRITGAAPSVVGEQAQRDLARRGETPPQSIKIGGKWHSYARVEPMATFLTPIVDAVTEYDRVRNDGKKVWPAVEDLWSKILTATADKTFMRGISDLLRAIREPEEAVRYAGNFATSWVPNIFKQSMRASDKYYREQRIGSGGDKEVRFWNRIKYGAFPMDEGNNLMPKVSPWGEDIKKPVQFNNPATDVLSKLFTPAQLTTPEGRDDKAVKIDRLITNYNNRHPNDVWAPEVPDRKISRDNAEVVLTDAQYYEMVKLAGDTALKMIRIPDSHVDKPSSTDIEIIKKSLSKAQGYARDVMWSRLGRNAILQKRLDMINDRISDPAFSNNMKYLEKEKARLEGMLGG